MERHEMQRQLIVQGARRSKQNKEDKSFYKIIHEPSYMFHKIKQKRRDGKHTHISHANTGIKQQHFTQTAGHVTTKYKVIKFNLYVFLFCKLIYYFANT